MDAGSLRVLTQLVDKLTDKRSYDWDPDALRRLKLICKKSGDPAVTAVFNMLMERVKDQHARVTFSTKPLSRLQGDVGHAVHAES